MSENRKGYLCVGRKVGEYIQVGNDVIIYVSSINGNSVKLGIHAPTKRVQRSKDEPMLGLLAEVVSETKAVTTDQG